MPDAWDGFASPVAAQTDTDPWAAVASPISPQTQPPLGGALRQQFDAATNAGANLLRPFFGQPQQNNTPDMDALRDKGWSGISTPQKVGAVEEAMMTSPPGQVATAIGGTVLNLPSLLMGKANEGLEAVGVPHQYSQAAEMALPLLAKGTPVAEAAETPRVPPVLDSTAADTPGVAPGAPLLDAMKTDGGKPLQITPKGLAQAHADLPTFLSADGIDLGKIADDLEAAQKVNPHVTALDVMAKDQGGIPQGSNMVGLAKSIAQSPGEGRTLAAEMTGRGYSASGRIADAFDQGLSDSPYYKVQKDAIQGKAGSGPLYEQAFNSAAPVDITPVLGSIDTQLASAKGGVQAALIKARSLLMDADGNPDTSLAGLHNSKLAIDDAIDAAAKDSSMGRVAKSALVDVQRQLLKQIDSSNPTYGQARSTYSTAARQQEALENGRGFMKMDPEEINSFLQDPNIPNPQKAAFASGARRALQDSLDQKNDTTNPIDALWKPNLQKRLQPFFPDKQSFDQFAANMEHEKTMARVNKIVQGSPTFANEQFSKTPVKTMTGHAIRLASDPLAAVGNLVGNFADEALTKSAKAMSQESKAAIARYLTTKDPQLLRNLAASIANPKASAEGRIIAGLKGTIPVIANAAPASTALNIAQQSLQQTPPPPDQPPLPPTAAAPPAAHPLIARIVQAESGGNPNAKNPNSTASGPLQFTNGTWAQMVARYGKQTGIDLKDKNNPQAQQVMGQLLAQDNAKVMTSKLGRPPTDGELYAAHFFGAPDVLKLINAQGSGKQAVMLYPRKLVNDNRPIFFDGSRPRTVEEVYSLLNNKVSG